MTLLKFVSILHPSGNSVASLQEGIRSRERIMIGLIVAAVFMSGVVFSVIQGNTLRFPDERDYVALARNISALQPYTLDGTNPTAYRPPGYPLFMAPFMYLGVDIVGLRILNYLLFGMSIVLLARIVRRMSDSTAGVLSALLMAFHGALFYAAGMLLPQTLVIFLLLLTINLVFSTNLTYFRSVTAGCVTGAHLLVSPSSIFLLLPFAAWFVWCKGLRPGLLRAGIFMFVSFAVVAPWTLRNYQVFGSFVPISTNSGLNLLLGNNEHATPSSGADVDIDRYRFMASGMNEAGTDSLFFSQAVEYIKSNKLRSVGMYLQKLPLYFGFGTEVSTAGGSQPVYKVLMLITYGPILILLLIRLALLTKFIPSAQELLFLSILLLSCLFFSFFFVRLRFRLPFDTLCVGVVSIFLANVLQRFRKSSKNFTVAHTQHIEVTR